MRSSSEVGAEPLAPAVLARELKAGYGGKAGSLGLRGFNAEFQPGITGLVGPNGAGKTTLLRTLAGSLPLLSGHLEILGDSPDSQRRRGKMGLLPENPSLPAYMTVEEFLTGLPTKGEDGCSAPGPSPSPFLPADLLPRFIGSLSLGQRKRVALAAALSGDPHLLLLDEPTNGLDPMGVRWLREVLLDLRGRGKVILISSHHLDELQRMADVLIFIRDGVVTGSWSQAEARKDFPSLEALFERQMQGGIT